MSEKTYKVTVKKWQLPRPSVYTPFFRRWFGNERSRELEETIALYESVRAQHEDWLKEHENARRIDLLVILDCAKIERGHALYAPFEKAVSSLLGWEGNVYDFPYTSWDVAVLSLKELVELRDQLRQKEHFLANEERVHHMLYFALDNLFTGLAAEAPKIGESALFVTPLILTYREPKLVADKVHGTLTEDEYWDNGLFRKYHEQMRYNICDIEKIAPDAEIKRPITAISDSPLSPIEVVERYFRKTPFRDLLLTPVPLDVSDEAFFSHMHVVGGSGAGKTQWLQSLIHYHLTQPDPPALIVVDSQGDLISNVSRLDLFHPEHGVLKDRILIITPREIHYPPAINIFDINRERLGKYEEATREQIVAGVIQTFDYLFTGLLGADLTAKQSVFFRFVARLMLALPATLGRNAAILDMMSLMENASPCREAIQSLPAIQRNFFERDFNNTSFRQTKEQIRYHLQAILENPTLERLFTSPRTKVDLFRELNRGSIILIDTAKDFLKDASPNFGRIFISLVLQAVLERAAIPERDRRAAFLIVDEAAEYFDQNVDDLLTTVRKYKLGCVFAHQYMEQCTPSLRASLAANTSIKMASGVSMSDARSLAPDLRTTPDFIISQPKLHFACYIRNVTGQAISLPVAAGLLESQPRMSESDYADLRLKNQPKVSTVLNEAEEPQPATEPKATPMKHTSDNEASRADMAKPVSEPRRPSPSTPPPDAPLENW